MKSNKLQNTSFAFISALAVSAFFSQAAHAENDPAVSIDALIDASSSSQGAIDLAREQAQAGKLMLAAATLERALLANPDADAVRLHYAAILCRLDDRQAADIELQKLEGRKTDDMAWAAVEQACGSKPRPKESGSSQSNALNGEISLGLAYDSDLQNELLLPLVGSTLPSKAGLSALASAKINAQFRSGDNGVIYAQLNVQTKKNLSAPDSQYQFGGIRVGYGKDLGNTSVSAGLIAKRAWLEGQPFVTEYGAEVQLVFKTKEKSTLKINFEAVKQDYNGSSVGFSRNGGRYRSALSYYVQPSEKFSYQIGAAIEYKTAPAAGTGYISPSLFAAAQFTLDKRGTYLNVSETYRYVSFRSDPLGFARHDNRLFSRIAIGTPIFSPQFMVEAAGNYSLRRYNDTGTFGGYDNYGAELRFIWAFGR